MSNGQIHVEEGFFDYKEAINSEGKLTTASVPYFVFNVSSEHDALEAVNAKASDRLGNLYLEEISIDERINDSTWKVVADYRKSESKDRESTTSPSEGSGDDITEYGNGEPSVSFDTTGGTRHVSKSIKTIGSYPENAPSFGGAIGVDGEGNIEGVDVVMPTMTFNETHYLAPNRVTSDFQKKLFTLTGKVNTENFRGFSAGEVLFLGVSAKRTGTGKEDLWELSYSFAVSPNQSNIDVGNNVTVASKGGWEYMWVRFTEKVENGKVVKVPTSAYVEQVYETADFSKLGINTKEVES